MHLGSAGAWRSMRSSSCRFGPGPISLTLSLLAVAACAAGDPEPSVSGGEQGQVSLVLSLPDDAEGPIWVRESDAESQPRWVAVRTAGPESSRAFLREQCAIPDCQGDGGVCGMALPVVRRLDPGDSIRFAWDGRTSRTLSDRRCEVREAVSDGTYEVEFCWTHQEPEPASDPVDGPDLVDMTCATQTVELPGHRRVSMVVQ